MGFRIMAFEKYVLCKQNEDCFIEDRLSRKTYDIQEAVVLLNELDNKYDELHDKLVQVLVKEYKTTRWRDEYANVRLELLTDLAKQFGVEL